MDFSLSFTPQLTALAPAARQAALLATNDAAQAQYGIRLTEADAALLLQTEQTVIAKEELVLMGAGILPRLVHWFLPSGCLGVQYVDTVAELTDAFYRVKGDLQGIYEQADDPDCVLSDNAILDYMYKFYTCSTCCGDVQEMLTQMERLICGGMQRLLEFRAEKRKAEMANHDPLLRLLYADRLADAAYEAAHDFAAQYEEELFDYEYRESMRQDVFGHYVEDYIPEARLGSRGSFAEELLAKLNRNPALLLPSAAQEAEWAEMVERWDEEDAVIMRRKGQADA